MSDHSLDEFKNLAGKGKGQVIGPDVAKQRNEQQKKSGENLKTLAKTLKTSSKPVSALKNSVKFGLGTGANIGVLGAKLFLGGSGLENKISYSKHGVSFDKAGWEKVKQLLKKANDKAKKTDKETSEALKSGNEAMSHGFNEVNQNLIKFDGRFEGVENAIESSTDTILASNSVTSKFLSKLSHSLAKPVTYPALKEPKAEKSVPDNSTLSKLALNVGQSSSLSAEYNEKNTQTVGILANAISNLANSSLIKGGKEKAIEVKEKSGGILSWAASFIGSISSSLLSTLGSLPGKLGDLAMGALTKLFPSMKILKVIPWLAKKFISFSGVLGSMALKFGSSVVGGIASAASTVGKIASAAGGGISTAVSTIGRGVASAAGAITAPVVGAVAAGGAVVAGLVEHRKTKENSVKNAYEKGNEDDVTSKATREGVSEKVAGARNQQKALKQLQPGTAKAMLESGQYDGYSKEDLQSYAAGKKVQTTTSDDLELSKYAYPKNSGVNIEGLKPELKQRLVKIAKQYFEKTGKKLRITDGFRSYEDQKALYDGYQSGKLKNRAAKPGTSLHESGMAVDIDPNQVDEMDKMGILEGSGFERIKGADERQHLQLKGASKSGLVSGDSEGPPKSASNTGKSSSVQVSQESGSGASPSVPSASSTSSSESASSNKNTNVSLFPPSIDPTLTALNLGLR